MPSGYSSPLDLGEPRQIGGLTTTPLNSSALNFDNSITVPPRPDNAEPGLVAVGNLLNDRQNAAAALSDDLNNDLVDYVKAHFDMSADAISDRYDYWREAELTHDVYVPASTVDEHGKRTDQRSIVDMIRTPYSRAMSDTRVTYMLAVFGGSPPFRLEPAEFKVKIKNAKILEQALSQNLSRVGWEATIYQAAMDDDRYGMSPTVLLWGDEGNRPINLNPWNYFPDPRVTAQNRDEAEFCGYRGHASLTALKRRNQYANLSKLPKSGDNTSWDCNKNIRENIRGQSVDQNDEMREGDPKYALGKAHVLNTIYCYLDPMDFGIQSAFGLYRIVVSDEKQIILFDKTPYPHGRIPILQGEGSYDAHKTFGGGTYDLLMSLQRFQDWLIRARVDNVQTVVQNRLVVDPTRINIMDILRPNNARTIRTLPGQPAKDAIVPITTPDVTSRFYQDIDAVGQLMQRVSAANDTAQGVEAETVRTATEIARLTSLGQQRMGTAARMKSALFMRELCQMMVSNLQYFGVEGGVVRLPQSMGSSEEDAWYKWAQEEILGRFDYIVSDGTLPVDPRESTEVLLRGLKTIADTGTGQNWDIDFWVEQVIRSMGFYNIDDWQRKGAPAPSPDVIQNAAPQNVVVPDEEILSEREKGNIVPLSTVPTETEQGSSP